MLAGEFEHLDVPLVGPVCLVLAAVFAPWIAAVRWSKRR